MQSDCLSLREYEKIAVRYLSKNLPSVRRNPDYINKILTYMLRADVSYIHGIGTLEGRRMKYAQFATKHIIASLKRAKNKQIWSLDKVLGGDKSRGEASSSNISYNEMTPLDEVEFNEIVDYIDSPALSGLETCAIREYYLEKRPMRETAEKFGVTRQAIFLAIERGLEKVRKIYGEEKSGS